MNMRGVIVVVLFVFSAFRVAYSQDNIQKQINECDSYVRKYREENNKQELMRYLNKMGFLYWQLQDHDNALNAFKESIKINEDQGNTNAIRTLCSNIGTLYIEKQDFENAIVFLNKSIRLCRQMKKKSDLLADLINVASAYQNLNNLTESSAMLEEGIDLAKELNDFKSLRACYSTYGENMQKTGNTGKAQEYFELAATLTRYLHKIQLEEFQKRTITAEQHSLTTEKTLRATNDTLQEVIHINTEKQLQIDLLSKEKQLKDLQLQAQQAQEKKRRQIITILSFILCFIIVSLLIIFKQLRDNKRANRLLAKSNEEINRQKKEIEEQNNITQSLNKKVTDSIQYASKIQNAVLPPQTLMSKYLKVHFIIYYPKNIVSGDFYWMKEIDNLLVIAVADCTGHGVPGAFMSMLGIAFLNDIINKMEVTDNAWSLHTDDILNHLRKNVIESLHQESMDTENKDGMDIALCIIDFKQNKLEFSGAHNPMCIFRNGELIFIEGDRLPVGMHPKMNKTFTRQEIRLEKNDMIYLYSDGYADQFGGKDKIKFTSGNLKKTLAEIQDKPSVQQKELLMRKHHEWRGEIEQLDDITVIGFRYNPI